MGALFATDGFAAALGALAAGFWFLQQRGVLRWTALTVAVAAPLAVLVDAATYVVSAVAVLTLRLLCTLTPAALHGKLGPLFFCLVAPAPALRALCPVPLASSWRGIVFKRTLQLVAITVAAALDAVSVASKALEVFLA